MKKGIIIGIIIVVVIIGTISAYFVIDENSNNSGEIIQSEPIPETTGINHSIELSEGLAITSP